MPDGYRASFVDGRSAQRHDVTATLAAAGLRIEGPDGFNVQLWPYDDLRLVDDLLPGRAVRLASSSVGDAQLTVSDPLFGVELKSRLPRPRHVGAAPAAERRRTLVIAASVAALCLTVILGAPYAAHWLVSLVPPSWEERIGQQVTDAIVEASHLTSGSVRKICTVPAGVAALDRLTARLAHTNDSPYAFRIRVVPQKIINALAAPGGHIVIFSGLIEFAESPDEVAGVLAHEMAHVIHRHVTNAALRELERNPI